MNKEGICKGCGRIFIKTNSNQKFCTKECRQEKCICLNCGGEFKQYKTNKKFCSTKCGKEYRKKQKTITKQCEYCGHDFDTTNKKQRFCSVRCVSDWRSDKSKTTGLCENCGREITFYIKYPRRFCSDKCMRTSDFKRECSRQQMLESNPMNNPDSVHKIKETKLDRYGDENYNNMEKNRQTKKERYGDETYTNMEQTKETCIKLYGGIGNGSPIIAKRIENTMMDKYGIPYAFLLPQSQSSKTRISKPQRKLYDRVKQVYPDAILEHYLTDIKKFADIYIPSINKIYEMFGTYWHCRPDIYQPEYYHDRLHMTAKECWIRDIQRIELIESFGYDIEIVWEPDINTVVIN